MSRYISTVFAEKTTTFQAITLAGHTATYADALLYMKQNPKFWEHRLRVADVENEDFDRVLWIAACLFLQSEHGLHPVGNTYCTPGAKALLDDVDEDALELFARHVCGDWGSVGKYGETSLTDDVRRRGPLATSEGDLLNKAAIEQGEGRIMSQYVVSNGERVWVITEADWKSTTIMLPEEY